MPTINTKPVDIAYNHLGFIWGLIAFKSSGPVSWACKPGMCECGGVGAVVNHTLFIVSICTGGKRALHTDWQVICPALPVLLLGTIRNRGNKNTGLLEVGVGCKLCFYISLHPALLG